MHQVNTTLWGAFAKSFTGLPCQHSTLPIQYCEDTGEINFVESEVILLKTQLIKTVENRSNWWLSIKTWILLTIWL